MDPIEIPVASPLGKVVVLRENLQSAMLQLPPKVIADLDASGTRPTESISRRRTVHHGTVASG